MIITPEQILALEACKPEPAITISFELFEILLATAKEFHKLSCFDDGLKVAKLIKDLADATQTNDNLGRQACLHESENRELLAKVNDNAANLAKLHTHYNELLSRRDDALADERVRILKLQEDVQRYADRGDEFKRQLEVVSADAKKLMATLANTREAAASMAESNLDLRHKLRFHKPGK